MVDFLRQFLGDFLPNWLIHLLAYGIMATILLVVAVLMTILLVWIERRGVARIQDRLGPNRVGFEGSLQLIADSAKLFTKEDIVPRNADRWVHLLAPIVTLASVALMLAVIPWGRGMVAVDINVAVLYVAAVSSVSGVGLLMAGWGSNNKFALLGAMRSVAQFVSYELPLILSLLVIVLLAGSMSIAGVPELQAGLPIVGTTIEGAPDLGLGWHVFTPVGALAFVIFFISALAEGERTPFDIPEADSEIVAGFMTEYSGMKFAVFYLSQYILNFVLAMIAAIAFLGGWQGPGVAWLVNSGNEIAGNLLSLFWMMLKTISLFVFMVLIRGAWPRLRVDQLMNLAWKFLFPLALFNIMSAAFWVAITQWGAAEGLPFLEGQTAIARQLIAWVVTLIINVSVVYWLLHINNKPPEEEEIITETVQEKQTGVASLS